MRKPVPSAAETLPADGTAGTLVGRVWGRHGPSPVVVREDGVYDISAVAPTVADLLATDEPAELIADAEGERVGSLDDLLAARDGLRVLAPCDLQAVKACGVTFVGSMLERVIEEQAKGNPGQAAGVRAAVAEALGDSLRDVVPGSPEAAKVKQVLEERGLWSQYLEVGIGPDAEIFTKCLPLAAVGTGAEIGIRPDSAWNNPEPEVVLAVSPSGAIVGATLGNDVNLRDFEGRSALLLGKAKDNRASAAIGPFVRLFDHTFDLDDVRNLEIALKVEGADGFVMQGASSMAEISRDPEDLVRQALGPHNQYPDGLMLYTGTLFAPTQDRDGEGRGFTHHAGDVVTISAPPLGSLVNRVNRTDRIEPWTFGTAALMRNLAKRGLLG